MVFSSKDLAVIENDYKEKGWSAYRIWKNHLTKKWHYSSVKRVVQKNRETGATERHGKPFESFDELKMRIKTIWGSCASNRLAIRKAVKQFRPRLKAVVEKDGQSIKKLFQ